MVLHTDSLFRFSVAIIFVSAIAFLTLGIGVFSPAWFVIERNSVQISEGPWCTRACPLAGGDCIISTSTVVYGMHSDGRGDSALRSEEWLSIKIESTSAVALACMSLIFGIIAFVKRTWNFVHWLLIIGGASILTSAILSLVAVLRVMFASNHLNVIAPWSRDTTLAGSITAFGASILYVFAVSQSCVRYIKFKRLKQTSGVQNAVPSGGENVIQFILMNNFRRDTSLHLYRQSVNSDVSNSMKSIPVAPPAYSDICGENH